MIEDHSISFLIDLEDRPTDREKLEKEKREIAIDTIRDELNSWLEETLEKHDFTEEQILEIKHDKNVLVGRMAMMIRMNAQ